MYTLLKDTVNTLTIPVASTADLGTVSIDLVLYEDRHDNCEVWSQTVDANIFCGYATFELEHTCTDVAKFHAETGEYLLKLFNSSDSAQISQVWVKLYYNGNS